MHTHIHMHIPLPSFLFLFLFLAITFLLPTPAASSLGINCRGSSECTSASLFHFPPHYNLLSSFYSALAFGNSTSVRGGPISPTATFASGQKIACRPNPRGVGGFCLFTQGRPAAIATRDQGESNAGTPATVVDGETVVRRVYELGVHGCAVCGSVPLSGDNDAGKEGTLISNYVLRGYCDGVC